jgi:HlyD family secretion protein
VKKSILNHTNNVKTITNNGVKKVVAFVDRKPFLSFIILLVLLVTAIVIGNLMRQPKEAPKAEKKQPKTVQVYRIGGAPKVRLQAQVEKSGVIQITALTGGVVQQIHFEPGQHITKGQTLVSLSSNYQGGNTFSLQRQIAQTQYNNVVESYDTQKDIIKKQREVAEKTNTNTEELRNITSKSIDETKSLISLNNDILSSLDRNLNQYTATNSGGVNDALILSTKQLKSQFQSANNQLNAALRSSEYQANADKPPAQLATLQKDIAIKQLEIQEKLLDLNKEVSRLQLQVARVTEGIMFPSSPFSGTVQRVFVKVGQAVNPGTPLMVLSQDIEEDPIVAIAYAPADIARNVSNIEPSTLYLGNFPYESYASYVTQDAVQGTLYAIYFPIPDSYNQYVTEKGYIQIDVPIGYFDTSAAVPFIPLDAVYQSQDESYVFVVQKGKVVARQVKLGQVYGRFVNVMGGLEKGDEVILDRNVIAGDEVNVQK